MFILKRNFCHLRSFLVTKVQLNCHEALEGMVDYINVGFFLNFFLGKGK